MFDSLINVHDLHDGLGERGCMSSSLGRFVKDEYLRRAV